MNLNALAAWYESSGMILVYIIVIFALLGVIGYLLYKFVMKKNSSSEDIEVKDDKQIAEEDLSRILEPIDDEDTAKEIEDYKEEDDK